MTTTASLTTHKPPVGAANAHSGRCDGRPEFTAPTPPPTAWAKFTPDQKAQRLATNRRWRHAHKNQHEQYHLDYAHRATRGAKRQFRAIFGESISSCGLTIIRMQELIAPHYKVTPHHGGRPYHEILDKAEAHHSAAPLKRGARRGNIQKCARKE